MRGTTGGIVKSPTQGFVCSTCGKQYRHSSHLRRHEASHLVPDGFKCQLCQKRFSRRDVWRKHYASCPNNLNQEGPPTVKRGKKPRACDACFRSKLSCDGNPSCSRCESRQLTCTYTRVQANVGDGASPSSSLDAPSMESASAKEDNTKIPVSFLLSLTNPAAESMVEAFFDEPGRDDDAPSVDLQQVPDASITSEAMAADALFLPWELPLDTTGFSFTPEPPSECTTPPTIDPALAPILAELKTLHTTLAATDPSYTGTFDDALAAQIFTRPNTDAFIPAYFRHTHRDMPLLHRPSFDPTTCSAPLLLTTFFCGALYSPPRDCVLASPAFFRITEEYIFRRLDAQLAQYSKHDSRSVQETELYETLQAALLIHGVQYMANNAAARRRRNWMVRRPALVAAVRVLGLTGARHTQAAGRMPEWRGFVRDETRIRIAATSLLTDWQQSGIFHVPTVMTAHEMTGQMPCSQELWEANDASEFEAVIVAKGEDCWRRTASLRDCIDVLMGETWSGIDRFPLAHLSIFDLHLILFAFHAMIGTARLMCLLQSSAAALLRATDRWQELWRATSGKLDEEQLRTSGYARHSNEFCWLARKSIEYSLEGKDRTSPYFQVIGHVSLKELHALVRELRGV